MNVLNSDKMAEMVTKPKHNNYCKNVSTTPWIGIKHSLVSSLVLCRCGQSDRMCVPWAVSGQWVVSGMSRRRRINKAAAAAAWVVPQGINRCMDGGDYPQNHQHHHHWKETMLDWASSLLPIVYNPRLPPGQQWQVSIAMAKFKPGTACRVSLKVTIATHPSLLHGFIRFLISTHNYS